MPESLSSPPGPLAFHRRLRDDHLRRVLTAGTSYWDSAHLPRREPRAWISSWRNELREASLHARESVRSRPLEWPDDQPDDTDRTLLGFVNELEAWVRLLDTLLTTDSDALAHLLVLLGDRFRHGQRLFQSSRRSTGSPW